MQERQLDKIADFRQVNNIDLNQCCYLKKHNNNNNKIRCSILSGVVFNTEYGIITGRLKTSLHVNMSNLYVGMMVLGERRDEDEFISTNNMPNTYASKHSDIEIHIDGFIFYDVSLNNMDEGWFAFYARIKKKDIESFLNYLRGGK